MKSGKCLLSSNAMKTGRYIFLSLIFLISCEERLRRPPTFSLIPESLSIDIGSVGELTLQINYLEDAIFGISLRIAYDSTGVSFAGSTEFGEGYFSSSEIVTFLKDTSSAIHIATTLTSGEGVSGSGILYTLEFEGKSQGSHLVEILPNFLFFYDSSGSKITIPNLIISSATINVE